MKNLLLPAAIFLLTFTACSSSPNKERPEGVIEKEFAIYETYTLYDLSGAFASIQKLTMENESAHDTLVNSQSANAVHPFFEKLLLAGEGNIAFVYPQDTSFVGEYLRSEAVRSLFPSDLKFAWSATTIASWDENEDKKGFILYALKIPKNGARIANEHIESAEVEYDAQMGQQYVNITMTESGAKRWKQMTSDNIGRCLAMTVNGSVYSCPMVHEAISDGRTQISGNFTVAEAKELAWAIQP